jgi:hypothetical protein
MPGFHRHTASGSFQTGCTCNVNGSGGSVATVNGNGREKLKKQRVSLNGFNEVNEVNEVNGSHHRITTTESPPQNHHHRITTTESPPSSPSLTSPTTATVVPGSRHQRYSSSKTIAIGRTCIERNATSGITTGVSGTGTALQTDGTSIPAINRT